MPYHAMTNRSAKSGSQAFHQPVSVYVGGVTPEYVLQIKAVVQSRLQTSEKIRTVVNKWWKPHRDGHGLEEYIEPGAVTRGGEMASFVLYMANSGRIKWSTMQGYVWTISTWHFNRFGASGDPLSGVADWGCFMAALQVQTWVDSIVEPRKMVPFMLMVRTLNNMDLNSRSEVALGCMMLMMYYTMSRSETPLPKSATSFDRAKHVRRKDVRLLFNQYVEWGFGSIKQKKRTDVDPDSRDWKPVGECTGVMSMRYWFDQYVSMSSWNSDEDPFFYDEKGPLVYHQMMKKMRACMSRVVTLEEAQTYGFHGLRVLGYNCWRAASGEEVAVLQGGWGSDGHRAYSREMLTKILGMAEKGAKYAAVQALPSMPLDNEVPNLPLLVDSHVFTAGAGSSSQLGPPPAVVLLAAPPSGVVPAAIGKKSLSASVSTTTLLPGVTRISHSSKRRSWMTYMFRGKTYKSRKLVAAACASLRASLHDAFVASLTNYKFL